MGTLIAASAAAIGLLVLGFCFDARIWDRFHPEMSAARGSVLAGTLGVASTLASAALFFGALLMQRKQLLLAREDLRLQRQELADTRGELAGQRKAMEAQRDLLQAEVRASAARSERELVTNLFAFRIQMEADANKVWGALAGAPPELRAKVEATTKLMDTIIKDTNSMSATEQATLRSWIHL